MLKTIVISLVSIVILTGCLPALKPNTAHELPLAPAEISDHVPEEPQSEPGDNPPVSLNTISDIEDTKPAPESKVTFTGKKLAGSSSPIFEFNNSDYQKALKTDKLIVLAFHADWCPICKKEYPDMLSAFNTLSGDNVVGFVVNYKDSRTDATEEDLARQFGVGYQTTKVFVKNGQRVFKSAPVAWSSSQFKTEINKFIK